MRSKSILVALLATLIFTTRASANFLVDTESQCNYRSLMNVDCEICDTVNNFTRDYPMGGPEPPQIESIEIQRQHPYPGEYVNVVITASSPGGVTDYLPITAQRILGIEVSVSMANGNSWYTNNWDSSRIGSGFPADYFVHEVLTVKNQGSILYKQYESELKPWAVSPESTSFDKNSDTPAPNRRCPSDPVLCDATNLAAYDVVDDEGKSRPWDDDCPWGLTCPLYDTFPPNTGENGGSTGWPAPSCSQADGDCNVPGFPEGGGDILDYFPSLDPLPMDSYPGVPGEPLVRVNGVPGIDCDIYNGVSRALHPLCDSPPDATAKAVYDQFGIRAYSIAPGQGMVRFKSALDPMDVVDATFYGSGMSKWTARLDMNETPFSVQNSFDGSFVLHVKAYDTCGNLASGAQSPPYPPFPGESNEAYIGVYDFYYDQRPTDTDPMGAIMDDDTNTQCGATDTWCPEDPKSREDRLLDGECFDEGCECCYNECSPARCVFDGALTPDVSGQCSNIGDSGNPPGCGPEYGSNKGMGELREFKLSHSASNLYVKLAAQGDMIWGCYGSWYPFVGCEYSLGELGSKFNGFAAQMQNSAEQGTFYLIIIPEIPIYGSLSLFIDLNKLLEEAMGSAYDGMELERYADGGGCKKPGEDEEDPGDPCEGLGDCDTPSADCDGDGFVNGTDPCPCEDGGVDSTDGCKPEDPDGGDPLADYKCGACQVGVDGNKMYVEMGIEDTVKPVGTGAYTAMGMMLGIHNLDMDWLLYYACLNGYSLTSLGTDLTPSINYYPFGNRARTTVELSADYTAPSDPSDNHTQACLGRCDETDRLDGVDNDSDLAQLEPLVNKRIDEGYDPTSTQAEIQFQEVVTNADSLKSSLIDLGGYEIQIGRDIDGPFETLYIMCDPSADPDCYGLNLLCNENYACTSDDQCQGYDPEPGTGAESNVHCRSGYCCYGGERDSPDLDEPYNGIYSMEERTRFPNPFNEDAPYNGYGFPGEIISCVLDTDCDLTHNDIDDDKDGLIDEGCWQSNCYDDGTTVTPDGQEYYLRVRAFDVPKEVASGTDLISYSDFTAPVQVKILRNTMPPAIPDVVSTYKMVEGGKTKVVWNPNKEHDIGGYAIYRCPANPLDAVIKTMDGSLASYCSDDSNFRMVHEDILDNLNGYFVDDGMGFYETGIYATSANPIGGTWATLTVTAGLNYIRDDKDNWDPITDDVGFDGTAGTGDMGEGDGIPTPGNITMIETYPGEPNAFEWIDCTDLTLNGAINQDLRYCGNIEDPDATNLFATDTELYNTEGVAQHLYDVSANPNYNANLHPPVLFYNGLVDGYKYYYKVKAIDSPYLGDGHNDISSSDNCDDGITPYDYVGPTGCVNPLSSRNCDDALVHNDWNKGGNCSGLSPVMIVTPADTQAPQKPISVTSNVESSGEAVTLKWGMSIDDRTVDHYNVYRAAEEERDFACVRGGCETAPYADGCPCDPDKPIASQCYQDPDGDWDRICAKPATICTNPPFYTIEAQQDSGCTEAPYSPGCVCETDDDCTEGLSCTWQYSICMIDQDNPPTGYSFLKDAIDNDGDGVIDEEFAQNGLDDDNDGLIDEDVGVQESQSSLKVGECPVPSWPYYDDSNWVSQERITSKTFTDHTIKKDRTYYYRISGVDNAVYDPNNGSSNDIDPPPPNQGIWSFSNIVSVPDVLAPAIVTGDCENALSHYPMPCVDTLDVDTYETTCDEDIDDNSDDTYGNQLSIYWHRSTVSDAQGYYVYRADGVTNEEDEDVPSTGAFERINGSLIAQKAAGAATVTMCFKDTDLANDFNYFYSVTVVDSHGNESYLSEINGPVRAQDVVAPMQPALGSSGGWKSDDNGLSITITWDEHEDYASAAIQLGDYSEVDFTHFNVYRSADDDTCDPSELICNNGACTSDDDCSGDDTCTNYVCCTPGECCAGDLTDSEFKDTDVEQNTTNSCDDIGGDDICYYYCVSAVDDEGNESTMLQFAEPARAMDQVPPVAPTGITTTPMGNLAIGIGWKQNAESDVLCYIPYRGTGPSTQFTALSLEDTDTGYTTVTNLDSATLECISTLEFTDKSTKSPGTSYYYKVTAVDTNGNESAKSSYSIVTPTLTDTTAPSAPAEMYLRAGFDMGELCSGCSLTNGEDDNDDGFIDEGLLKANYIELMWDRVADADMDSYEIYRRSPATTTGCDETTCDVDENPTGDCDSDGTLNAVDDCPCIPKSPSTSQLGDYVLLTTKTADSVCPTSGVRPDGTVTGNICQYQDKNGGDGICAGSRYWYAVVPVDEDGNSDGLDKTQARAVTPTARTDTTSPEKPSKPSIGVAKDGTKLVVKFTENDETEEDNMDLMGYIIYRDTTPAGSFNTKVAILNDTSQLNYCKGLYGISCDIDSDCTAEYGSSSGYECKDSVCTKTSYPPCYCDKINPDHACFLDVSVNIGSRYFYKISAFDYTGNESELSDWAFGLPSPEAPEAAEWITAMPRSSDQNALRVTWDPGSLLDDDNVAGFTLKRSTSMDGNWTTLDPNPDTNVIEYIRASSYLDTGLTAQSTYYYMLLTVSANDDELVSPSLTACGVPGEDVFQPGAPVGLSATPGDKVVTLSWQQNSESDLGGYNVYRSTSKTAGTFQQINTTKLTAPTYTDSSGLLNGTIYYYCITAYDNSPTYDTEGCYSNLDDESACSTIIPAMPNTYSSGVPKTVLSLSVNKGWNLVFAPGSKTSTSRTLTLDESLTDYVFTYNPLDVRYSAMRLGPELSGDLLGEGFWYYADEDETEIVANGLFGTESPFTMNLEQGWNLVGNPYATSIAWSNDFIQVSTDGGVTSISIEEAMSSGIIASVWQWNAVEQKFKKLEVTNLGVDLAPGHGVLVWASQTSVTVSISN